MRENWFKIKYFFAYNLKKLWCSYKIYIIILSVFFLISFVTGIITCSQYSSDMKCENLINKYLFDFLANEINWLSYFLIMIVFFTILCWFTLITLRNKFMSIIHIVLLFFMGYIYGFDLCVMIITLGLPGIFFGCLFYGLFGIVLFLLHIILISFLLKNLYCKDTYQKVIIKSLCKSTLVINLLGAVILFLSVFFFNVIHIFVIIE